MNQIRIPAPIISLLAETLEALEAGVCEAKTLPVWLPNGESVTRLSEMAAMLHLDEATTAQVVLKSHNPPRELLAEAKDRVRTPAGALRYGQPIGAEITRDRQSWASRVLSATAKGGITLSFADGGEPSTGYAVAARGMNREIPDSVFFNKRDGIDALRSWLVEHGDAFEDPQAHLGIWYDTEHHEVCLDVSYVVADRADAVRLGQRNNQQAIWDIANFEEISTGGTGDRKGMLFRRVRSRAGEQRYGQPRGSVIVRDKPSRTMAALMAGASLVMLAGEGPPDHLEASSHHEVGVSAHAFHDHKRRGVDILNQYVSARQTVFDENPANYLTITHTGDEVVLNIAKGVRA